jgi:hypothetical protein
MLKRFVSMPDQIARHPASRRGIIGGMDEPNPIIAHRNDVPPPTRQSTLAYIALVALAGAVIAAFSRF